MVKVVTADQMRQIEARAAKIGLTAPILMENAGLAAAREVKKYLGEIAGLKILVLVGPGNNGGDGLAAARHLHDFGALVAVYLCAARPPEDKNLKLVAAREVNVISGSQDTGLAILHQELTETDAVIDAIFGTGKLRPLEGIFKDILIKMSDLRKERKDLRVIALDLPSGLNPDNGAVDPACPTADLTITLSSPKVGLYAFPGAEKTGRVVIADIGIPGKLSDDINLSLLTGEWVRDRLPARPLHANKGTFGRAMVVAGSINYIGAAYLACEAACRAGAGLVTLAAPKSLVPVLATRLTEVTYVPLPEAGNGCIAAEAASVIEKSLSGYDALLIGCGLGQNLATKEFLKAILLSPSNVLPNKVLVDADGLNILSGIKGWPERWGGDAVLTPHPGEMARLSGQPVEQIQSDRLGTAQKAAKEWGKTVVLKGAFSIIASPRGQAMISPVAEPALASAGTGDVLSGIIVGMMAQGMDNYTAAGVGVYLHTAAAQLAVQQVGRVGVLASDLLPAIPQAIEKLGEPNYADSRRG